jgi:threonine aldolase
VPPLRKFERIRSIADRLQLPVHLDGARLFNAAVYLGVEAREISRFADSVMVSLSKGLGAPVGSMLCGDGDFIRRAVRYRKMLGGGMRQTGWLCACGLQALSRDNIEALAEDHVNAKLLARGLSRLEGIEVNLERTHTNYVVAAVKREGFDPSGFMGKLEERGVLATCSGEGILRFVTSKEVSRTDIERVLSVIEEVYVKG